MFEFEATIRILVTVAISLGLIIGSAFAVKALLRKSVHPHDDDRLAAADDRLARIEGKMVELEERLDFTERVLGEVRGRPQLPKP